MFSKLRVKMENMLKRARFIKPKRALFFFGVSSYLIASGVWLHLNPDAYDASLTNTVHSLTRIYIPQPLRTPIYQYFARRYGVNLDEVEKSLPEYTTFNEFFTRKVIGREIDPQSL